MFSFFQELNWVHISTCISRFEFSSKFVYICGFDPILRTTTLDFKIFKEEQWAKYIRGLAFSLSCLFVRCLEVTPSRQGSIAKKYWRARHLYKGNQSLSRDKIGLDYFQFISPWMISHFWDLFFSSQNVKKTYTSSGHRREDGSCKNHCQIFSNKTQQSLTMTRPRHRYGTCRTAKSSFKYSKRFWRHQYAGDDVNKLPLPPVRQDDTTHTTIVYKDKHWLKSLDKMTKKNQVAS